MRHAVDVGLAHRALGFSALIHHSRGLASVSARWRRPRWHGRRHESLAVAHSHRGRRCATGGQDRCSCEDLRHASGARLGRVEPPSRRLEHGRDLGSHRLLHRDAASSGPDRHPRPDGDDLRPGPLRRGPSPALRRHRRVLRNWAGLIGQLRGLHGDFHRPPLHVGRRHGGPFSGHNRHSFLPVSSRPCCSHRELPRSWQANRAQPRVRNSGDYLAVRTGVPRHCPGHGRISV